MRLVKSLILFLTLTFVLVACNTSQAVAPIETPPIPKLTRTAVPVLSPDFKFFGEDPAIPVVPNSLVGDWDGKYVNPGAMLYHDGKFHMFRNGFLSWPGFVAVGYMTSEDGYVWTPVQDEPVFTSDEVPFADPAMLVTSAFVMEDGTWVLLFSTFNTSTADSLIGRATAPSPLGPWNVDPEPILNPGGPGSWDENNVRWPNVVETEEGYVMFYGADDAAANFSIGRATSTDGITWTKYNDPETNEDPFIESDPVIAPGRGWDIRDVNRPVVQLTPDGYVMIYMGGIINRRGLAVSLDGIHWEHFEKNPIITEGDFPLSGSTWDTALLYVNGVYYYYMEIGTGAATNIYLTTHEGSLFR